MVFWGGSFISKISQLRWALVRYRSAPRPLSSLPVFALDSTYCGVGKVHPNFTSYLFLCNGAAPHIFQQITHIVNCPLYDLLPVISEPCSLFFFNILCWMWKLVLLNRRNACKEVENISYINGTVLRVEQETVGIHEVERKRGFAYTYLASRHSVRPPHPHPA